MKEKPLYLKDKIYLKMKKRELQNQYDLIDRWSKIYSNVYKVQKHAVKNGHLRYQNINQVTSFVEFHSYPLIQIGNKVPKHKAIKIELSIVKNEIIRCKKTVRDLSTMVNQMIKQNEKLGNFVCDSIEFQADRLTGRIMGLVRNFM